MIKIIEVEFDRNNYPKYNIYWNKEQADSTWNLWVKVEQTVNISPPYFTMPIELKINYASGDTVIKLFNNCQIQEYLISVSNEPISIVFDPNNRILKDVLSIVLGTENENFPAEFNLYQPRILR